MQDMLPGVLSIVLTLLGPTVTNSSSLPIECRTTMNSSVLHSLLNVSTPYRVYGICHIVGEQIRRLDYKTQYVVLSRRFDTSYPTGGYGLSESLYCTHTVQQDSLELIQGRKPNLHYFHVFGFLCYLTNDRDDLGKMKPKADIGSGFNCSNFQDSSEDSQSVPSKTNLDNLFGPLYEEYYATSTTDVSDNSDANTLDNEDTPIS
ncbi:hypothetical protein Tco_0368087 [Tanacetum coccineum]